MQTKENLNLIMNADAIMHDENESGAENLGLELAEVLGLKSDGFGKYPTSWGMKTNIGLARTIIGFLQSPESRVIRDK